MTVLIVDDSSNTRAAVQKSLELIPDIDHIIHAEDVDDGIEMVEQYLPDLIILDLMLKTGTGIDVLKGIKELSEEIYIILYSNFLSNETFGIENEYNINAFFDKSDDILELVELVKKAISSDSMSK